MLSMLHPPAKIDICDEKGAQVRQIFWGLTRGGPPQMLGGVAASQLIRPCILHLYRGPWEVRHTAKFYRGH